MSEPSATVLKAVKDRLTKAGQDWHRVAKHPGSYDHCKQQTCYRTHPAVIA